MKIVVVGTGAFGTALAHRFQSKFTKHQTKDKVVMYGINTKEISEINLHHKNSKYYSNILNANLSATLNPKEAFYDADVIVLALPSNVVLSTIKEVIIKNLNKKAYFINVAKGLDPLSGKTITELMKKIIPEELTKGILKLSGPSFAIELMQKQPTFFTLASNDIKSANKLKELLSSVYIHIESSKELLGVEWVSILKNPLSLLMGIISGLGYKMNTKALFFSKAVEEIGAILEAMGINKDVLLTPAGIGDMFLTGSSKKSRNFQTGYKIGKADKITKKILLTFNTIEGLKSIEKIISLANTLKIRVYLLELLYNIIDKKQIPSKTVEEYFEIYKNN